MVEKIRFAKELDAKDIVLVYRDEENNYFLGHAFYYGGRESTFLLYMYKDKLPMKDDKDIVLAWNHLDDTSYHIVVVGEPTEAIAVEDFLYSHKLEKDWTTIDYRKVDDYIELNKDFEKLEIPAGTTVGYIISK